MNKKNLRAILLVVAIALGVLGTAVVAYKVWSNQYNSVRVSLLQEQEQALQLLATEYEARMHTIVSQVLRYLLVDNIDLMPSRIEQLKQYYPALEQVLRFDATGGLLYCIPGPSAIDDYRQWLSLKLNRAVNSRENGDFSIGSFQEMHEGQEVLFVFAPIPQNLNLMPGNGWLVMRYSVNQLINSYWQPLKTDFIERYKGSVELNKTKKRAAMNTVHEPVLRYLSGWTLSYKPDSVRMDNIAQQQGMMLVLLIIGFGSLPIAAGVCYWWYSRKDLLLAESKADFVSHVSHELKTPLSLIRMYAETLEMSRVTEPAKTRQYLDTIIHESDHLTHIINQILDYSREQKGDFHYHFDNTDIVATILQAVEKFKPKIQQLGFRLEQEVDSELPELAHDKSAIKGVVLNLLDNAIKYSPEPKKILVQLQTDNRRLVLTVADRGQGLPLESRGRLTEPFVRGQQFNDNYTKGAGLGLAMVSRAVKAHCGQFELLPRKGGGVIASISLPLSAEVRS